MSIVINEHHHRQDLYQDREYDPRRRRYSFAAELLPRARMGATFIDIGGGAGEFTQIARDAGYRTTLVDGNASSLERERARGFEALQADLNYGLQGIDKEKFDGAACLEVIEHIVPAEQLLREIYRVLRPGGFLILSTPNFGYFLDRFKYLAGQDVKEEGYHYRFFTKRRLEQLMQDAGFIIESKKSFGSAIGVNFLLRLLTRGKLRIPHFSVPVYFESWLASTFVIRATKHGSGVID